MSQHDRPNILAIMSDQHSPHVLGCYGDRVVRTPNLDRLAAEGMRFDNAYCASPLCVPSRMSFMTCRTPSHNRVWNNNHVLSPGIPTWAHVLGLAGYETLLFGRMHFNGPDQHHGFERRPAGHVHSKHPGVDLPGGRMWQVFPGSTCGQCREAVEIAGTGRVYYQYLDDRATDAACDWLRSRGRGKGARPFAAVLGTMLPHCPFIAPKELFDYYLDRVDVPAVEVSPRGSAREERQPSSITRFRRNRDILRPLSEHQVRVARAAYYALCEYADATVGRALNALRESGLDRDTLVVYTSDHGEMAGEHGCWWKSNYYEGSVRVPMIARLPGVVPSGAAEPGVCNLMDLGVTFAEAAGGAFASAVEGHSLRPMLQGRRPAGRPGETFSELVDERNGGAPSRMIRRGDWKMWVFDEGDGSAPEVALFNLSDDPGELHNLADDPAHGDVRADLLRRLYARWDPPSARAASEEANADWELLVRHGKALQPPHECAPTLPEGYEHFTQR